MHPHWAVIGDPVEHSLSPKLFLWLLSHVGIDGSYRKQHVRPSALASFVHTVRAGGMDGFNVTLPHKQEVLSLLDDVTDQAKQVGAVNCVARREHKLVGTNTDVDGVVLALQRLNVELKQKAAVVFGAGGAARAAVVACEKLGVAQVDVVNRTLKKAQELVTSLQQQTPHLQLDALALADDGLAEKIQNATLNIQASSVGLKSTESILDDVEFKFSAKQIVMDMVYSPLETSFLKKAKAEGARCQDGLWMLVYQALASFSFWTQTTVDDDVAAPLHEHLVGLLSNPLPDNQGSDDVREAVLRGRQEINAIDRELVQLLAARAKVARSIGAVKAKLAEPVVRPERENQLRKLHEDWAEEFGVSHDVVKSVFDSVLNESRKIQSELASKDVSD
ncbi:MAG: shikimate dehydrogenase [Deltaproteobacteria bacterium]|nr:shikimate dehydrogenase [Deltaproteobacteria bacterium]